MDSYVEKEYSWTVEHLYNSANNLMIWAANVSSDFSKEPFDVWLPRIRSNGDHQRAGYTDLDQGAKANFDMAEKAMASYLLIEKYLCFALKV